MRFEIDTSKLTIKYSKTNHSIVKQLKWTLIHFFKINSSSLYCYSMFLTFKKILKMSKIKVLI